MIVDEAYLSFVRARPACLLCPKPPDDAHHLVNRGTREHKRNDYTAIPACRECHTQIHSVGLLRTLGERGITVARLCEAVAMQLVDYFRLTGAGVSADPTAPF